MAFNSATMPSPNAVRPDSTGTLRTTITLGKNPSVSGPFYLIRAENTEETQLTGSKNLLEHYDLDGSYYRMCSTSKQKEELSAFLPTLPGFFDIPAAEDGSSLKQLYENPPRVRKEIEPLPPALMAGFRLQVGKLPEKFRLMDIDVMKKLHKKRRRREEAAAPASAEQEASPEVKRIRTERDDKRRSKKKDKKRKRKEEHQNGV